MTTAVALTSTLFGWNGTKAVHVTLSKGSKPCYATGGTSAPNKAAFHVLQESVMNISEGFSIWMWNGNAYEIEIAYSEAT